MRNLISLHRPEALLFDCDGVLVDTEPDGHRVAFNEAFRQKGGAHEVAAFRSWQHRSMQI